MKVILRILQCRPFCFLKICFVPPLINCESFVYADNGSLLINYFPRIIYCLDIFAMRKLRARFRIGKDKPRPLSEASDSVIEQKKPELKEIPVVGIWNYEANEGELSFRVGDILLVSPPADESEGLNSWNWLKARDWKTQKSGMIPGNFVSDQLGDYTAFDAYHHINREEAENQLRVPIIEIGTYLIRPSRRAPFLYYIFVKKSVILLNNPDAMKFTAILFLAL